MYRFGSVDHDSWNLSTLNITMSSYNTGYNIVSKYIYLFHLFNMLLF